MCGNWPDDTEFFWIRAIIYAWTLAACRRPNAWTLSYPYQRPTARIRPQGRPKKPLELLKAIIAFGGSNVATERICDALWPDADGDRALNSFKFAIHQLRRLLEA